MDTGMSLLVINMMMTAISQPAERVTPVAAPAR
jgi:hypothetical protein